MQTDDAPAAAEPLASPTTASASGGNRRAPPPDHLPLDDVQWALFAASFAHVGPRPGLRRLMARSGEAMRRAGIAPPEPIGPQHDIAAFDCGVEQINSALQHSAGRLDSVPAPRSPATRTFVIAAGRQVVGYYTARPGSVFRAGGEENERIRVTIIRQFAVDRRWANNEIATDLLWHLVRDAHAGASESGARALFGYAINLPVKRFYMRQGARPLPELVHRRATMITFADVADALGASSGNCEPPGAKSDGSLCIDDRVARSERFVGAEAAGQFHVLDIDRGESVGLNEVGARIWALIAAPVRIADVCATLQSEFDVDAAVCRREVLALLDTMRGSRMVVVRYREIHQLR